MTILALLNRPLTNLSIALPAIAGAIASFDRIQDYLNVDEKEDKRTWSQPVSSLSKTEKQSATQDSTESDGQGLEETNGKAISETLTEETSLPDGIIVTVNATLTWPGAEKPVLDIRHLSIPSSVVTVLLGPTGCGKTTLLNTILGELTAFEGTIRIASLDISYCAQKPWLPNCTIREAIVGKLDYDDEWYSRTISACALQQDFDALVLGDQSLLGNKGTLLSGGQKQRMVSIARCR